MNTKRLRAFVAIGMLALMITPGTVMAQGADCDDNNSGCTAWKDLGGETVTYNGCTFTFGDVQVRLCNGVPEVNYSGLSTMDGSTDLSGACALFSDSTILQLADLIIMNELQNWVSALGPAYSGYTYSLAPCTNPPSANGQEVQFITTSCYLWQGCTYATNATPTCVPPEHSPGPAPGSVTVWTYQDCGTACCERTYNVCLDELGDLIVRLINQHIINPPGCSKNANGYWTSQQCNNGCG